MSFECLVENQILAAQERGEFDNLPGRGQPLDLTGYFNTPSELRLGYALLKGAQFVPPEVELQRAREDLRAQLAATTDESRRTALKQEIANSTLKLNLLSDSRQRAAPRR